MPSLFGKRPPMGSTVIFITTTTTTTTTTNDNITNYDNDNNDTLTRDTPIFHMRNLLGWLRLGWLKVPQIT